MSRCRNRPKSSAVPQRHDEICDRGDGRCLVIMHRKGRTYILSISWHVFLTTSSTFRNFKRENERGFLSRLKRFFNIWSSATTTLQWNILIQQIDLRIRWFDSSIDTRNSAVSEMISSGGSARLFKFWGQSLLGFADPMWQSRFYKIDRNR